MRALLFVAALLAAAVSIGCEALLDVGDPTAGRPCDATGTCLPGFVCTSGVCVTAPPVVHPPDIGNPCASNADCNSTDLCLSEAQNSFPGGYCSADCTSAACPTGSHCVVLNLTTVTVPRCAANCSSSTDCRGGDPDYDCYDYDGDEVLECLPVIP